MLPVNSQRKRKRPLHQPLVNYRSEQEIDSAGRIREVIVIDDTPPPQSTPSTVNDVTIPITSSSVASLSNGVRTRAQVAAANGTSSMYNHPRQSNSISTAVSVPAAKRRRKDDPVASTSGGTGPRVAPSSSAGSALARKALAGRAYDHQSVKSSVAGWGTASGVGGTSSVREVRPILHLFLIFFRVSDLFFQSISSVASTRQQQTAQQQAQVYDDKEGHYIINVGDTIGTPARCKFSQFLTRSSHH
jgi:hypothetical protein